MRRCWLFYRCRLRGACVRVLGVVYPRWFRVRRKAIHIYLNDHWHVLKGGAFVSRDCTFPCPHGRP